MDVDDGWAAGSLPGLLGFDLELGLGSLLDEDASNGGAMMVMGVDGSKPMLSPMVSRAFSKVLLNFSWMTLMHMDVSARPNRK